MDPGPFTYWDINKDSDSVFNGLELSGNRRIGDPFTSLLPKTKSLLVNFPNDPKMGNIFRIAQYIPEVLFFNNSGVCSSIMKGLFVYIEQRRIHAIS